MHVKQNLTTPEYNPQNVFDSLLSFCVVIYLWVVCDGPQQAISHLLEPLRSAVSKEALHYA